MRLLKPLAIPAFILFALVAIVFLMGSALPREHDATAAITIHASQGKLWSLMEDVEGQTRWRTGLKSVGSCRTTTTATAAGSKCNVA